MGTKRAARCQSAVPHAVFAIAVFAIACSSPAASPGNPVAPPPPPQPVAAQTPDAAPAAVVDAAPIERPAVLVSPCALGSADHRDATYRLGVLKTEIDTLTPTGVHRVAAALLKTSPPTRASSSAASLEMFPSARQPARLRFCSSGTTTARVGLKPRSVRPEIDGPSFPRTSDP